MEGITIPVLSVEMEHVLMERLEKEIASKLGGSICRSVSRRNVSGKKRRRESQNENLALGSGAVQQKQMKMLTMKK